MKWVHKLTGLILLFGLLIGMMTTGVQAVATTPEIVVNATVVQFDGAKPYVDSNSGVLMAPLTPLAEAMGLTVEWNNDTQTARVSGSWTFETTPYVGQRGGPMTYSRFGIIEPDGVLHDDDPIFQNSIEAMYTIRRIIDYKIGESDCYGYVEVHMPASLEYGVHYKKNHVYRNRLNSCNSNVDVALRDGAVYVSARALGLNFFYNIYEDGKGYINIFDRHIEKPPFIVREHAEDFWKATGRIDMLAGVIMQDLLLNTMLDDDFPILFWQLENPYTYATPKGSGMFFGQIWERFLESFDEGQYSEANWKAYIKNAPSDLSLEFNELNLTGQQYHQIINSGMSYLEFKQTQEFKDMLKANHIPYPSETGSVKQPIQNEAVTASPTASKVFVNGKETSFDSYTINQNNYFKIRDIAYALNGTGKQFEVVWDDSKNAISMTSNHGYSVVGGEMALGDGADKTATLNTAKVYLDGKEISLTAYTINGNNYVKLRDLGQLFNFGVSWNGAVVIDTSIGYADDTQSQTMTPEQKAALDEHNAELVAGGGSYQSGVEWMEELAKMTDEELEAAGFTIHGD